MATTPLRRQPSVQVNEHSGFALDLMRYLNELKGEMSGRAFAKAAATGTHDHWAKILAGTKVMTTNDVKVAADVLGITPYAFVAGAKEFAESNVGPLDDDGRVLTREQEQELRQSDLDLAAKRGRNEAEIPHAE